MRLCCSIGGDYVGVIVAHVLLLHGADVCDNVGEDCVKVGLEDGDSRAVCEQVANHVEGGVGFQVVDQVVGVVEERSAQPGAVEGWRRCCRRTGES